MEANNEVKKKKKKSKKKSKKSLRRWLWPIEKLLVFIVILAAIFTFEFSAHLTEGGDKVSVEAGKCYINDVEQESFYRIKGSVKEHTIGANQYFVLNDYRIDTNDSRTFGDINASAIEGTYFCSFHTGVI